MNAVRYNKSYLFSYITAICLGSFQYGIIQIILFYVGYNFTNFVFLGNMKTKDFASTQFLHLYVAGISIATGALVGSFIGGYFVNLCALDIYIYIYKYRYTNIYYRHIVHEE